MSYDEKRVLVHVESKFNKAEVDGYQRYVDKKQAEINVNWQKTMRYMAVGISVARSWFMLFARTLRNLKGPMSALETAIYDIIMIVFTTLTDIAMTLIAAGAETFGATAIMGVILIGIAAEFQLMESYAVYAKMQGLKQGLDTAAAGVDTLHYTLLTGMRYT